MVEGGHLEQMSLHVYCCDIVDFAKPPDVCRWKVVMDQSQELQQVGRMVLEGRGGTTGAPQWWEKSSRWMGSFKPSG